MGAHACTCMKSNVLSKFQPDRIFWSQVSHALTCLPTLCWDFYPSLKIHFKCYNTHFQSSSLNTPLWLPRHLSILQLQQISHCTKLFTKVSVWPDSKSCFMVVHFITGLDTELIWTSMKTWMKGTHKWGLKYNIQTILGWELFKFPF